MQNLILRHIYKKSFFSFSEPFRPGLLLKFVKSVSVTKKNFSSKRQYDIKKPRIWFRIRWKTQLKKTKNLFYKCLPQSHFRSGRLHFVEKKVKIVVHFSATIPPSTESLPPLRSQNHQTGWCPCGSLNFNFKLSRVDDTSCLFLGGEGHMFTTFFMTVYQKELYRRPCQIWPIPGGRLGKKQNYSKTRLIMVSINISEHSQDQIQELHIFFLLIFALVSFQLLALENPRSDRRERVKGR